MWGHTPHAPCNMSSIGDELGRRLAGSGCKRLALWAMGVVEHVAMEFPDSDAVAESTVLCSEAVDGFIDGTMDHQEVRRRAVSVKRSSIHADGMESVALMTIHHAISTCIDAGQGVRVSECASKVMAELYPDADTDDELEWQLSYLSRLS